jgi:MFS family permease
MMVVNLLGLGCAILSAAGIAVLAATDPKRRRGVSRAARTGGRALLWLMVLAPGLALGFAGRWSDFLIWVGAAAILGWAIAALTNAWPRTNQSRAD